MSPALRKGLKWAAGIVGGLVILIVAAGAYVYSQLPKPIGEPPVLQAELFSRPDPPLPVDARFLNLPATELAAMIREKRASSVEIVQAHINHIRNTNYRTNAFVWLFEADALAAARAADAKVARGEPLGLLHGVPVSIKEQFAIKGKPHTLNAEMFRGNIATRTAPVVEAWIEQGAVIVGTTNVSNLLLDVQTHGEIYPTGNNPYSAAHTPGGSTGGGAASVAAGLVPLALGGDMGGSIRVPAAFCGVYGLKTTEGAMGKVTSSFPGSPGNPRYLALAVAGPIAANLGDLELGWNALMSKWPEQRAAMAEPKSDLAAYRVAYLDEWVFGNHRMVVAAEVKDRLKSLVDRLAKEGVAVSRDQPADFAEMIVMHRLLSTYMAFERVPWLFRQLMARRFKAKDDGRIDSSEAYARMGDMDPERYDDIVRRRAALTARLDGFFAKYDVLLLPVTSGPAIRHNPMREPIPVDGQPVAYWSYFLYPMAFNATGHPALTIPLGLNAEGLPLAVQVVGPMNSERRLLKFAQLIAPLHPGFVPPPGVAAR